MVLVLCPNPAVDTLLWLEDLKLNEMSRASRVQRYPGGKGVHVAMALKELGEDCHLLAFWGGPSGIWIREALSKLSVPSSGPTVDEWTRTCLTIRLADSPGETEILEPGPNISKEMSDEFFREYEKLLKVAKIVVMSGSLPQGLPSSFYAECVRRAQARSVPTVLDFTGPALEACLPLKPSALHLNQTESEKQTGVSALPDIVRKLSGVQCLAITRGAEGVYVSHGQALRHGYLRLEKVLGTVGSGDCLVAGLTLALVRGLDLENTVRWAAACGAANCLREELGMLYKSDVEKLIPQVRVTETV